MPLGLDKVDVKRNVLIFDLGGDLFYLSALDVQDGTIDNRSTEDTSFSKESLDSQTVSYFMAKIMCKHKDI